MPTLPLVDLFFQTRTRRWSGHNKSANKVQGKRTSKERRTGWVCKCPSCQGRGSCCFNFQSKLLPDTNKNLQALTNEDAGLLEGDEEQEFTGQIKQQQIRWRHLSSATFPHFNFQESCWHRDGIQKFWPEVGRVWPIHMQLHSEWSAPGAWGQVTLFLSRHPSKKTIILLPGVAILQLLTGRRRL